MCYLLPYRKESHKRSKKVDPNDVDIMLYCDKTEKYYNDYREFVEEYQDKYIAGEIGVGDIPDALWVTEEERIHLDAWSIIEDACDDLHEDAAESCDCETLQTLLDIWCEAQTGTTTYYPCYDKYVRVNKEDITELK